MANLQGAEVERDTEGWRELTWPGLVVHEAAWTDQAATWLTPRALAILAELHRELEPERQQLLRARLARQAEWDRGGLPGYLDGEVSMRARGAWQIAPLPADLQRRRVEITGPVDSAKMVIQMLSPNDEGVAADAAMLDFEDSMKPEWSRVIQGIENVARAARGELALDVPDGAGGTKHYRLDPDAMPLLMVRCRGLHLDESNLRVDGEPVSGGLFDLTLTAFHAAAALLARGRTPKYYVPKCEHHLEARFWNRLFGRLEDALALRRGTLRATFLIETLPAAFQMEEILWELRGRIAGLNVGRWDKIFSDIKTLGEHPDRVLADRATIALDRPWMHAYAEQLVRLCHRHGAFAMGGMAAFTPGKTAERRAEQRAKVVADKVFEAGLGHDGCWVSHPYFIGAALSAFTSDHQLAVVPPGSDRPDLLPQGGGPRTLAGLAKNARVGIAYLEGWRRGLGCVAWDDLMEDLATLEISRAQTWQWLRHGILLDDGVPVTLERVQRTFAGEAARIDAELAAASRPAAERERYALAAAEAALIFTEPALRPFLALASPPAA